MSGLLRVSTWLQVTWVLASCARAHQEPTTASHPVGPTAVSSTSLAVCVWEDGSVRCTGGETRAAPASMPNVSIWPDQFATGFLPCVVPESGALTCLQTPLLGGWVHPRAAEVGAELRFVHGLPVYVRGDEVIVHMSLEPDAAVLRLRVPGLLDASVSDAVAVLTSEGVFRHPFDRLEEQVQVAPTPGATRLTVIRHVWSSTIIAWSPGSMRYYWLPPLAPRSDAPPSRDAPEPLTFLTGSPSEASFCAIGASGRVYCGDDASLQCPSSDPRHLAGALIRQVTLPGAATALSVGMGYACAIVGPDVYCWGRNGRHERMGRGQPECVSEPVRVEIDR